MPAQSNSHYAQLVAAINRDPLTFPRIAWSASMWSKQSDLYRAFHASKRVYAKGGHATGKTQAAAWFVAEYVATHVDAQVLILGPTYEQAKRGLWQSIRRAYYSSRVDLGGEMGTDAWTLGPGWWARCQGANKPETLQGVHGKNVLVVIDEASGVDSDLWPAIESLMASEGASTFLLFNPTRPDGRTREVADNPRWTGITLSCLEHPNVVSGEEVYPGAVTAAWVEETRERCERTADKNYWRSRVLGEFADGSSDALVTASDLEKSLAATVTRDDVRRLSLDVARFGDDKNVLTFVDEKRRASMVAEWTGVDLMTTTGRLIAEVRRRNVNPSCVYVDSCGVGGGVVDRAREQGVPVRGIDFGSGPRGDWSRLVGRETRFANRRAECYWALRCSIQAGELAVPREYWSDLAMVSTGYSSNGDIKIKSKDEMRKDHGRSPDRADSLALAFGGTGASFLIATG